MGRGPWDDVVLERVDGSTVTVRSIRSEGRPVVLVHGIGVSARYFEPLARELARNTSVYAVELPGFGSSPGPRRALSVPELGEIVLTVLQRLDLGDVVLVGHSMGCQVATEAALRDPKRISRLVLLGPTTNDHERSIRKQALRLAQDTLRESPVVNFVVFTDYLRSIVPYLRTLPAMVNHRLEDAITDVTCPVVLMRGAQDPIVPADWLRRLALANRHAAIVEVEGAPHVLMYHHAAETAHGMLTRDPHAAA